ncbi:MAG: lipopolysaccharide biosynthesis [Rhodobacteraceae bacterium]|nr:lipopolysaccharide biosynthesis [Paracoccaceae bacterium]MAY47687.1 lipopolysaccharide biosynthesis [Paracoccaceae bacterium]
MDDIRFYLSVFARRLHWFFLVVVVCTMAAVIYALGLTPTYVSKMQLVVESPQIPENLAASTAQTPALEQLEIIEQRLLTRDNLLGIAREFQVLPAVDEMSPDNIVSIMRAATRIRTVSGRDKATLMTVSFEAGRAQTAAAVLNEYLNIIQESDTEIRRGRAGGTLEFFREEVKRLGEEVDQQSAEILAFKQSNRDALPDSLEFRMTQRSDLQEDYLDLQREVKRLESQRDRLIQLFEATGLATADNRAATGGLTSNERMLLDLESELSSQLVTLSEENPKVKLLRARIDRLKQSMADDKEQRDEDVESDISAPKTQAEATLDVQLSEIDSEISILQNQLENVDKQIEAVTETINRTPEVSITVDEMERQQVILGDQYNKAEARLAQAMTGDLIEARSRGQRISVIEQPNVPDFPSKPNRPKIAALGAALGIAAGLALMVVMELLNTSLRRPEDLVAHLNVTPFGTIPYMRTRWETLMQRSLKVTSVLVVLAGIPAAIYAIHVYYYPIDLMAAQIMGKLEGAVASATRGQ